MGIVIQTKPNCYRLDGPLLRAMTDFGRMDSSYSLQSEIASTNAWSSFAIGLLATASACRRASAAKPGARIIAIASIRARRFLFVTTVRAPQGSFIRPNTYTGMTRIASPSLLQQDEERQRGEAAQRWWGGNCTSIRTKFSCRTPSFSQGIRGNFSPSRAKTPGGGGGEPDERSAALILRLNSTIACWPALPLRRALRISPT